MGMESHASSCYCCVKPSTSQASGMDIDAALNELGMLSTTSNSRREYLRECAAKRDRTISEPASGMTRNFSDPVALCTSGGACNGKAVSPVAPTPSNSPSRPSVIGPGYKTIIRLNSQFLTRIGLFSSGPGPNHEPPPLSSVAAAVVATSSDTEPENIQLRVTDFGAKYNQDSLEHNAHTSRTSRSRLARLKRFKKPYDVPWRHQVDKCIILPSGGVLPERSASRSYSSNTSTLDKCIILPSGGVLPERSASRSYSSNTSTPEKSASAGEDVNYGQAAEVCTVTRSKSLDEIDFNQLRLSEAVNLNYNAQGKEIDSMAQHLQNLQVNE